MQHLRPGEPTVGSRARPVITAITTQGLSQAEAARTNGLSQAWVSRLMAEDRVEGEAAFEPRSRRPKAASPRALPVEVRDLILRLRKKLGDAGLDADPTPSPGTSSTTTGRGHSHSTISRHLARAGLVVVARG
jgi:transposase